MYEYITGTVAELTPAAAVIETGGIGYWVHISLQTYSAIEQLTEAKLYLHHVVREDAQLLYGFHTKGERELFRLLIGVSGVGAATARVILSTYSPRELQSIIATENATLLKNVKGLGLKTAQKIIVELSGKMIGLGLSDETENIVLPVSKADVTHSREYEETLAALVMLGFPKAAAEKGIKALFAEEPGLTVEEAVRQALKRL